MNRKQLHLLYYPYMSSPPKSLQGTLWSCRIADLDLVSDKNYIIHQVLAFGSFPELRWMFHTYSREEITRVFVSHPAKTYRRQTFVFVKQLVLKVKIPLPESAYVINTPRKKNNGRTSRVAFSIAKLNH